MQQAVEGTGTKQANLEDYNPFDAQKNQTTSANNAGKWRNRKITLELFAIKFNLSKYFWLHELIIINILGQPAVMNPTSTHEEPPPPSYTKSGQQQISTADFQVRLDSLN